MSDWQCSDWIVYKPIYITLYSVLYLSFLKSWEIHKFEKKKKSEMASWSRNSKSYIGKIIHVTIMKAYAGVNIYLHLFLISTL
jgi:hypothetical protein